MTMMKFRCFIGALCLVGLAMPVAQAGELRGAWLARDSMVTRAALATAMDTLAANNFNIVYVNAWSRGYPLWKSRVFQQHTGLLTDPGFGGRDLLAEAVVEGHRAGLEVECWFEYGFVGGWDGYYPGRSGKGPIFDAHPEWLARNRSGSDAFPSGASGFYYWMAHARPEVQQFLTDLVLETVREYDIDGVEFDRARYPNTDCGYDSETRRLFRLEHGDLDPPSDPNDASWMRWRANKLNAFVVSLYQAVKSIRPEITVSNAPIVYPYGYVNFLQDYPSWLALSALDIVAPQIYRSTNAAYSAELGNQLKYASNKSKFFAGIDTSNPAPAEVLEMVRTTRLRGLGGMIFWYMVSLQNDFALLKNEVFQQQSDIPYRDPAWRRALLLLDESGGDAARNGAWNTAAGGWNGSALNAAGAEPASISYYFTPDRTACYQAYAYQSPAAQKTQKARFTLRDRCGASSEAEINQQSTVNDGWVALGTVCLDKSKRQAVVTLDNTRGSPGELLGADAVMLIESHLPAVASRASYCIEENAAQRYRLTEFAENVRTGHSSVFPSAGSAPAGMAMFASWSPSGPSGSRVLLSAAGVPAMRPSRSFAMFAEFGELTQTGMAVSNLSGSPAALRLRLRDAAGNPFQGGSGEVSLRLESGNQSARFLSEFFPFVKGNQSGSLELSSDQPVASVTLRGTTNERSEFVMTTMPVIQLDAPRPQGNPIFPQIADGGGYSTQLWLLNNSDAQIEGSVDFLASSGQPLSITIAGETRSAWTYSIPAKGVRFWATAGEAAATRIGYAVVRPAAGQIPPAASCVFSFRQAGGVRTEVGVPETRAVRQTRIYLRHQKNLGSEELPGLAVANAGDSPATLRLTLFSMDGSEILASGTQVLPARAHSSRFLAEWLAGTPETFQGLLQLEADVPVAALGLLGILNQRGDFLMSAVAAADTENAAVRSFPHLAAGGAFTTDLVLLGGPGGSEKTAGRLDYWLADGMAWPLRMR